MWCDFPHPEKTEGVSTLQVGLNGKEREVDVCAEHDLMLSEPFGMAIAVGRKVPPKPARPPKKVPAPQDDGTPRRRARNPATGAYNAALRAYVDDNNLRHPKDHSRLWYKTPGGSDWYPDALKEAFARDYPAEAAALACLRRRWRLRGPDHFDQGLSACLAVGDPEFNLVRADLIRAGHRPVAPAIPQPCFQHVRDPQMKRRPGHKLVCMMSSHAL